jgi:predicted ester cyclase
MTTPSTIVSLSVGILAAVVSSAQSTYRKTLTHDTTMETNTQKHKEVILHLYDDILNNRKFDAAAEIVSSEYRNSSGDKGIAAFTTGMIAVTKALPDAHWTILDVVADGDKVMVRQQVDGTHNGFFQDIAPTNRKVSNSGFVVYYFKDGKIVHHEILTDRLTFLQQLGILPVDFTRRTNGTVFFVDKFFIPKGAVSAFMERMEYNRNFISKLPGFIKDEVIIRNAPTGELILMTIAVWKSQHDLDEARKLVQAAYQKINFNPAQFTQQLGITMERELYHRHQK